MTDIISDCGPAGLDWVKEQEAKRWNAKRAYRPPGLGVWTLGLHGRTFKGKQRELAKRLLKERKKTLMSYKEIARRCGVSTGTIYLFRKELEK